MMTNIAFATLSRGATACGLALTLLAAFAPPAAAQRKSAPPADLREAQPKATQIILDAVRGESAELRMHAIEASQWLPDRALPLVQLAMEDPNPAVRFAALVTAGRLKLASVGKAASRLAQDDAQPPYVTAAAIFAADACGADSDLGRLGSMLWHPQLEVRSNAAMLLGLTGEASAVPMLRESADDPLPRARPAARALLQLQIAEAMVKLGNEDDLKVLRGAAYSSEDEVRILAVLMLGRLSDHGMRGNFITFLAKNPVELRLAAAEALARLGSLEGVPVMLEAASLPAATVKAQAAFALGQAASDPRASMALQRLLDDPDPMVRVAAAAATLEALQQR